LNFIRDEPAEEDFFRSHSRLAHAVASTLMGQAGLKVVGLLGPWGSGKSTAIRLLQKELEGGDSDHETFCFCPSALWQAFDQFEHVV
jgi:ABC-type uncharacterized transport system ATPase subunit